MVGCGHVSGLLMRRAWPLALMRYADRGLFRQDFKLRHDPPRLAVTMADAHVIP